ncbi:DNA-directed RNA polymerase subunit alpha [Oribacterium sp. P6A1]|uniref:DNA-directed RNA polymerase subunit alpha n=1 Tax=Oribacterium sp. P6A1 TaxID=1410612 RepID=UPI0005622668|nr:DNA-directed RNA polymerase subunit alpha [Oribacterium sp. P6A1]
MAVEIKPVLEVEEISDDKKFGRFVCAPLAKGEGTVIGNSLRRILLSSMPGAAVSEVKIDGVYHEFSSIPGVKEDVSDIILNLKKLAIKNTSSSDDPVMAYIDYAGEGIVRGSDIKVTSEVEIVNKDQVIATLSGKEARLYMEIKMTKGRGYDGANTRDRSDLPIGVIAVDSIYCPVVRVNMVIDQIEGTNEEKLTLDVTTNGTMAPDDAVSLSARILDSHLKLFADMDVSVESEVKVEDAGNSDSNDLMNMNIDELELSVRSYNCLKRAGINTVGDLCSKNLEDLSKVRNMGRKSIDEILGKLESMGLVLSSRDAE